MADPVVLITGGSRGIGAATAISAARAGFDIALTYQSAGPAAEQVCEQVRALGQQAFAVKADVALESQVIDAFAALDERFGRLDALVNNAGIVAPAMPFEQYSGERISKLLAVNVFGAFIVAREAVKRMSTLHGGSGGSIVNVSSAASRMGSPGEYIDYAATKGAMDSMTIGLAKELGSQGVRVNAVRPGLIETDIHASGGRPDRVAQLGHTVPLGRGGTAQEVADTIVFLMSPQAGYISGSLVDIGGGR